MDMRGMFENCTSFNQNLSGWNVNNALDMYDMFEVTPMETQTNTLRKESHNISKNGQNDVPF